MLDCAISLIGICLLVNPLILVVDEVAEPAPRLSAYQIGAAHLHHKRA